MHARLRTCLRAQGKKETPQTVKDFRSKGNRNDFFMLALRLTQNPSPRIRTEMCQLCRPGLCGQVASSWRKSSLNNRLEDQFLCPSEYRDLLDQKWQPCPLHASGCCRKCGKASWN